MDLALHASTIDRVVVSQAATRPDAAALYCDGVRLTFSELRQRADGLARWMLDAGLGAGDHVALWLPNGVAWAIAHVAISTIGGVTVPVSTRLTAEEAAYIIDHSGSVLVIAADRFLDREYGSEARALTADAGRRADPVVAVDQRGENLPFAAGAAAPSASDPEAAAVIQYTSGTTGRPKGCVLSHGAWTNNARLSALVAGIDANDVVFSPSPFFHLFGSLTGLMGAISVGAEFITSPTFDARATVSLIQKRGVTRLVAVPTVWLDIMRDERASDLRTLRGGVWGGGSFPQPALSRAMNEFKWQMVAIYGMTEAPTLTQTRPEDPEDKQLETVGRATPHVELTIRNAETGEEVSQGTAGEICARGYNRALGYLADPAGMNRRIRDGWFRSGDLGVLDEDGFLQVTGRLTDMVVTGGANVYAREVEDVILRHEAVELVAVVARPDERLGEVPVAWVQPMPGHTVDPGALIEHCRRHLAGYKVPRDLVVVARLPRTETGKIAKAEIVQMTHERQKAQAQP